jgi:hypothetical protein
MKPTDIKIEVFTKDDEKEGGDGLYCAIVLGLNVKVSSGWYNTGIIVRKDNPVEAFNEAMTEARLRGWWR